MRCLSYINCRGAPGKTYNYVKTKDALLIMQTLILLYRCL
jgi:hypothetical protein